MEGGTGYSKEFDAEISTFYERAVAPSELAGRHLLPGARRARGRPAKAPRWERHVRRERGRSSALGCPRGSGRRRHGDGPAGPPRAAGPGPAGASALAAGRGDTWPHGGRRGGSGPAPSSGARGAGSVLVLARAALVLAAWAVRAPTLARCRVSDAPGFAPLGAAARTPPLSPGGGAGLPGPSRAFPASRTSPERGRQQPRGRPREVPCAGREVRESAPPQTPDPRPGPGHPRRARLLGVRPRLTPLSFLLFCSPCLFPQMSFQYFFFDLEYFLRSYF